MYRPVIKPSLEKKLFKIKKKNPEQARWIRNKIAQIIENPHHYKPLSNKLKNRWRVHFGSYVLVFKIYEQEKVVKFIDYDHHDNIYK